MPKRTLEKLAEDLYDDPELCAWIVEQVREAKTEEHILNGSRSLPHPEDAARNYQIAHGTFFATDKERQLAQDNDALKKRLDKIEAQLAQQPATE